MLLYLHQEPLELSIQPVKLEMNVITSRILLWFFLEKVRIDIVSDQ